MNNYYITFGSEGQPFKGWLDNHRGGNNRASVQDFQSNVSIQGNWRYTIKILFDIRRRNL